MELLNSTPSPPINVVNNHRTSNRDSTQLENSTAMEPSNLSQSAARVLNTLSIEVPRPARQTYVERNLELKLPILSSSSSDSETEEPANPTAGTSVGADADRAASPPPNCAICLGRCKNKCFTDSCMHQFCFKCLCEWSKVKPECPLCKQTFKSIIHNVKSIHQFEEYHVQPPTVQIAHPPFEMDFQEMRIFGVVHPGHNRSLAWNEATHRPFFYGDFSASSFYSAASAPASSARGSPSTASGSSSNRSIPFSANGTGFRNQYVYRELLDLYRQEYPGAIANSGTLSQLWRRYVYDRKLYAMPVADITGRFRESSARFYRDNPSQIHRLMPWINRDIVCLLRQTQHDVTTVLESINAALTIMNISAPTFRRRLQPFLGTKTAHFIHELNNFARSPYDMIGYDRAVQYLPQTNNEEIVIEFSTSDDSTDNEQIDVAGDGGNTNTTSTSTSRSRATNTSSINAINLTIHNRLTSGSANAVAGGSRGGITGSGQNEVLDDISLVIDLRGEPDNNEAIASTAQATTSSSNYQMNLPAGASEDDVATTSGTQLAVAENIELTSGSSDECEFVLERKPPHLRTPEMVSLDSASDSDVVFVDESKPLSKTSFSSSEGELNEGPSGHKHHSRHHNKIAALVEAKKRNQSANLVKSEQQDAHEDDYNQGASTSAALRSSLQRRGKKSQRSDGSGNGKRLRHSMYSLRNFDATPRPSLKTRGKRLYSESSHSSTSSSSTTTSSSSSTTTSTNSSSSSSDEDYVASTSQRKRTSSARRTEKPKKRKTNKRSTRRTAKRASKDRKNNDYTSDEDLSDQTGNNLALTMALNERRKMVEEEEESDGENSWRLKAVNEPLRKQQQKEQQRRTKRSYKSNERKRKHKSPTQRQQQQQQQQKPTDNREVVKRQRNENQTKQQEETQNPEYFLNSEDTSSDESDNINLIQLKTKLTAQDCQKELRMEQTNINQVPEQTANLETETYLNIGNDSNENYITATAAATAAASAAASAAATATATAASSSPSVNIDTTVTAMSVPTAEYSSIPSDFITEALITAPRTIQRDEHATVTTPANDASSNVEDTMTQHDNLLNFADDSNDNIQNYSEHNQTDNNNQESITHYQHDQRHHLLSSSSNNYIDNNNDNPQCSRNDENINDDDNGGNDDQEDAFRNVALTMNLTESNVFADGTSMSTTTTDTILHEAAEQISSAAVNFYNPQQTFNTADFADENSTNSSSSDSSISSSTTSQSSSSNSSSS